MPTVSSLFVGLRGAQADEKTRNGGGFRRLSLYEKYKQLIERHAAPFIRDVLKRFRDHSITAAQGADELQISQRHFYNLRHRFLQAVSAHLTRSWSPKTSGGNHRKPWPALVLALLKKTSLRPSAPFRQLCRFRSLAPSRAQTRPRFRPPLGFEK